MLFVLLYINYEYSNNHFLEVDEVGVAPEKEYATHTASSVRAYEHLTASGLIPEEIAC
jgi:hypothetical protein